MNLSSTLLLSLIVAFAFSNFYQTESRPFVNKLGPIIIKNSYERRGLHSKGGEGGSDENPPVFMPNAHSVPNPIEKPDDEPTFHSGVKNSTSNPAVDQSSENQNDDDADDDDGGDEGNLMSELASIV
ncbi:hypothetical protein CROQUDRAFT_133743 [Cronartium quercuum f. sp. fusiforme G11]|uniref:Uncharacterized protein n=1 Tax=Cronartium quercuum f. sp. fusiforme G11 TaxID=708437 RepID=A0A9P6TB99_9BASI|nr:hypothetical protein CROQUDRAFT_133743 [Cronartium quercuum f. sp. fusiforme G11]